ncbi:HD domain-containing protein [Occallatibacter riparius]|uniref:HD domain-containing protein n=1 Tax=Occallatibacter riparius TaxID=1002689 RepID=A0A9J7BGW7_9BACT|nr:HD domain-containing protein [Occallatibacter riparius]UWZ82032.1 HD domain-containing protein [Occallatibacter riparius]
MTELIDPKLFSDDVMMKKFRFIVELDKLKMVFRRTLLLDKSRTENDAEHSWEMATMALVLHSYAEPGTDLLRVLKMLLIHDLVEIDAGDTYVYDRVGIRDQPERESAAASRIFGLLEDPEGAELHALWREFEDRITPEARFARALDRLQPLFHNYCTAGQVWRQNAIKASQVRQAMQVIREGSATLGLFADRLIDASVEEGYLATSDEG